MNNTRTVYRVRDWDIHFESSESRKLKGALKWFPCPTKLDGLTYRRLMKRPDGVEIYGCWTILRSVAAKAPVRGVLASGDGPLSAADLADMTGMPVECVKKTIEVLLSDEFRWLEEVDYNPNPLESQQVAADAAGSRCDPMYRRHDTTRDDTTLQNTNGTEQTPSGFYGKITLESMKTVHGLMAWLRRSTDPTLKFDDYLTRQRIVGAAIYAGTTKTVRKPIAAFVDLVRGRHWDRITDDQMNTAKKQLVAWENAQRPAMPVVAEAAKHLAAPELPGDAA